MATFEYKDNTGTLRKNDRKAEGSNQPDYKGSGKIDGANKDFSAWIKKDKNGVTFMSLVFNPPYNNKKVAGDDDTAPRKAAKPAFEDLDSDLPF